jgi:NarL family two-component system response regulator LiaR
VSESGAIRVMIVDDHLMVRDGIGVFLSVFDDLEVVAEAGDGEQALELCAQAQPDVILMDILMPGMDGPAATRQIRQEYPQIQVIALTSFVEEELVQRALQAGAIGYLLKDVHADRLAGAIREAHRGRGTIDAAAAQALIDGANAQPAPDFGLTRREREILGLLVAGKTNKQIAEALTLSLGTIRFHISNILSKMGVSNRTEAVSLALQNGLVERK